MRVVILAAVVLLLAACSGPASREASPTATVFPTSTVAPASTPTATGPATATPSPSPTSTPSPTPEPTATPSPAATATPQPTATPEPTSTPEPTATPTTPPPAADVITIRRADTTEKIVALTFDAGSDRGYAAEILDTLKANGIHATFGMTGVWAEQNPDLVRRMADEGHQLINHTWDHASWTGYSTGKPPISAAERASELTRTEAAVQEIAGYDMRPYFRPTYGDYDDSVLADLLVNGYTVNVMWTVDSLGWNGLSAPEIVRRTVDGAVPGAIHLFHVGAASADAQALPEIISQLRDAGYRFVTVEQMGGR